MFVYFPDKQEIYRSDRREIVPVEVELEMRGCEIPDIQNSLRHMNLTALRTEDRNLEIVFADFDKNFLQLGLAPEKISAYRLVFDKHAFFVAFGRGYSPKEIYSIVSEEEAFPELLNRMRYAARRNKTDSSHLQ